MQDQRIARVFPAAAADDARHRRRGKRHDLWGRAGWTPHPERRRRATR